MDTGVYVLKANNTHGIKKLNFTLSVTGILVIFLIFKKIEITAIYCIQLL